MNRITLQQLTTFLYLAEHPNLSQAASELYIAQPALSKSISSLEYRLCCTLFERTNRGLILTDAGAQLYHDLRTPVRKIESILNNLNPGPKPKKKTLKIGYPSSFDYNADFNIVRSTVRKYRELYPDVNVMEYLYEFVPLRNALLNSEVDLLIGLKVLSANLPGTISKDIKLIRLNIAMSANHRLAHTDITSPLQLKDETFLEVFCYEAPPEEKAMLQKIWGFPPKIESVPNFQTLTRALSQEKGISLCSCFAGVSTEIELVYKPFPDLLPLNPSAITLIWRYQDVSDNAKKLINLFSTL
jgi:DNA-binding transcriptional LysR family regulator